MNRRRFLTRSVALANVALTSVTFTSVASLMAATGSARAFTTQSCESTPGTADCQEIARHAALLSDLKARLAQSGLSESNQRLALASLTCPVCGQAITG